MENLLQLERELSQIQSAQAAHTEQIRTICLRLDKQDKMIATLNDLALSVRDLKNVQANMGRRLDSMGGALEELRQKPARRWEALADKLILTAAAAVAAYVLGRVGL